MQATELTSRRAASTVVGSRNVRGSRRAVVAAATPSHPNIREAAQARGKR